MSDSEIRLRLARPGFDLAVDLRLPAQGTTVLYGASGSGKTSVLRCVAGLERAAHARVCIAGQTWQDDAQGIFLPTWQRPLGYVFQEASLFEHLSVQRNLEFGLQRTGGAQGRQLLADAVELLGIGHLLRRPPGGLSGGERQRVAIARALVTQPRLLLLDEPLASLDAARRQDILPWLARLRASWRLPMLYVTHSADELSRLADHLVVLADGRVTASGPVGQVLASLHPPVVVGDDAGVLLEAAVLECDATWHLARLAFDGGSLWVRDTGLVPGQRLRVRVKAQDVTLALQPLEGTSAQNQLAGTIDGIEPDAHPSQALVRIACGPSRLMARITRRAAHELELVPGRSVWAQVKTAAIVQ